MSETKDDDDKEPASEPIAEEKADGEKALVVQDQVRERALATASSSSSSRQMALAEDLALAKEIRSEKKEQFYATAGDDKAAQTSPVVKVCCGAAALAILLLVGFVAYSLLASQYSDASLEEKIISGDKLEGLKALRQHSIQNLFSTFAIVVGVLVLGIFAGFGLMLYFKDTTQHQSQRRMEMVRAATNTFEFSEDLMAQLTANLQVQLATVGNLERDVERYTEQIEKLNEEGSNNREQIDELQEQKAKKEAELSATQATVKATRRSLDEAKTREEGLREDLRTKEETLQEQQQESSRARNEASRLQDSMRRSETEASSLRSRARCLEQSVTENQSRARQLELDNVRLNEEVKRKPSRSISIWI